MEPFTPAAVEPVCGIPAARIAALARSLAEAPTAAVYGRIGTCTVEFGTLTSWLVLVINALTGNLDRAGGMMFPLPPHDRPGPGHGRGFGTGRWTSRVRGVPEVLGELPAATLAEEIGTPGEGQVRALVTLAGNPVLSTPNGGRLDRAIASLEFMVSVDPYLNETTRHADVILPPTDPARDSHYDRSFLGFAVHNVAVYSPPTLAPDPGGLDECEILARLTSPDSDAVHEQLVMGLLERACADQDSPVAGRDPRELRGLVGGDTPAARLVDTRVRLGAYGDGFGADPDGLTLSVLLAHPHGVDLGPLKPRIPDVLRTPSGRVELCAAPLAADVGRLSAALGRRAEGMVLVGRRDVRSNNSWLHNLPVLVKGRERCTLQVHPDDASRLGLSPGGAAKVDVACRRAGGDGGGHRRGHGRRREPAPRVGPRPARHRVVGGPHAARHQQQPAHRRGGDRPAVGQRRAERHPRDRLRRLGHHRALGAAVGRDLAVGEAPDAVDPAEAVDVAAPVVEAVGHEHLVVAAAVGVVGAVDVDLQRGGVVAQMGLAARRRRFEHPVPGPAEQPGDGVAPVEGLPGDLQHGVGGEQRDHLVEAPDVGARVVAGDQVADGLAGEQLVEVHRYSTASGLTGEPVPHGTTSGAHTNWNSQRPAAAHARPMSSRSALSMIGMPMYGISM